MFHFETTRNSYLYLVLSDSVSISSDIKVFQGRSLPLPSILREAIVGGKNSIFETYKVCPFSDRTDAQAALSTQEDEFALLLADYLLGRTSEIVMSYPTFRGELLRGARNQGVVEEKIGDWLYGILTRYLIYLKEIGINNRTRDASEGVYTIPISVTGDELDRITQLTKVLDLIEQGSPTLTFGDYSKIMAEFQSDASSDKFGTALSPSNLNVDKGGPITSDQLIDLVYCVARSGMGKSQFMLARQKSEAMQVEPA